MPAHDKNCAFGDYQIQPDHNLVTKDGVSVQVSPRVMDVLMHLLRNNDRVVPADELLDKFWHDRVVEESTIHRHISQIRTALGDSARDAKYIKTVSKRGYQAIAPVTPIAPDLQTHEIEIVQPQAATRQSTEVSETVEPLLHPRDASHVFVSYSHHDAEVVYPEIEWLTDQGVDVWHDKGISPGANWLSVIGDALLGASRVLFFVSDHSIESDHCNREISLALDEGITIIPIYLQDVELTSDLKVGLLLSFI